MENVNVKIEAGVQTLEILTGKALVRNEPKKLEVSGNIDAPLLFIKAKKEAFKPIESVIIVEREKMSITFQSNHSDIYSPIIEGKLTLSAQFKTFGLNSGKRVTPFDLANLIRMNRASFESKEVAMKLVSDLQKFKAKVDKQIENADDKRGNTTQLRIQAVETNLPAAFTLLIPIFKGSEAEHIKVEIDIDPSTLEASLISPVANEIIQTSIDRIIDEQKNLILSESPAIAILEA